MTQFEASLYLERHLGLLQEAAHWFSEQNRSACRIALMCKGHALGAFTPETARCFLFLGPVSWRVLAECLTLNVEGHQSVIRVMFFYKSKCLFSQGLHSLCLYITCSCGLVKGGHEIPITNGQGIRKIWFGLSAIFGTHASFFASQFNFSAWINR